MTACSVPRCGRDAALQWQRAVTSAEHHSYVAAQQAQQAADAQAKRDEIATQAATLRMVAERFPHSLDGDRRRRRVSDRAAQLEAQVAELEATPMPSVTPDVVMVAVFACEKHAVDGESAARPHGADCCTTTQGCRCGGTNDGGNA